MSARSLVLVIVLCATGLVPACLEPRAGALGEVDSGDAQASPDTASVDGAVPVDTAVADSAVADTAVADTTVADSVVAPIATLTGVWERQTIGNCINVLERLSFDSPAGGATWLVADNNACRGPTLAVEHVGTASATDDHVVDLAFASEAWSPREVRWTWAISPGTPPTLTTAAFRRVPGTDRWRRDDRELNGTGTERWEKRLLVEVTLTGYPEVTAMGVSFDVSRTFGDGTPPRGAKGTLTLAAGRTVNRDGRAAIAATGFEAEDHPDYYHFDQQLLARFDGHTVDLIREAFFPVLYEVEGDPDSLYLSQSDRSWYAAP